MDATRRPALRCAALRCTAMARAMRRRRQSRARVCVCGRVDRLGLWVSSCSPCASSPPACRRHPRRHPRRSSPACWAGAEPQDAENQHKAKPPVPASSPPACLVSSVRPRPALPCLAPDLHAAHRARTHTHTKKGREDAPGDRPKVDGVLPWLRAPPSAADVRAFLTASPAERAPLHTHAQQGTARY